MYIVPAPTEFTRKQIYIVSFSVLSNVQVRILFGIIMVLFGIFSVLVGILISTLKSVSFHVLFG